MSTSLPKDCSDSRVCSSSGRGDAFALVGGLAGLDVRANFPAVLEMAASLVGFDARDERAKPHLRDWMIDQVHRICDAAGVPRVTAHAMRGLLATLTAERGLLGHLIRRDARARGRAHDDARVCGARFKGCWRYSSRLDHPRRRTPSKDQPDHAPGSFSS